MNKDFLTLEEAAHALKKSTQTIRRMIKKGELQAQRIKTPQGFHYVVTRAQLAPLLEEVLTAVEPEAPAETVFYNSPIQNELEPQQEEKKEVLINQTQILTNQNVVKPLPEPVQVPIDKKEPVVFYFPPLPPAPSVEARDLLRLIERQHREHLGLIRIIERLQEELHNERQRSKNQED